jgi:hypothetical protein
MKKLRVLLGKMMVVAAGFTLAGLAASMQAADGSLIVNIDFNGYRPGDNLGPTFVGKGAAGGGTVFNGLTADSTGGDDNLTVGGVSLLDSLGGVTPISFTLSPVGGDSLLTGTVNPTSANALFGDYVFNNSAGNTAGDSPFTIDGLGSAPMVDVYVYQGNFVGGVTIPGSTPVSFTGKGTFTSANTRVFRAPVVNGQVTGSMGGGLTVVYGLSIVAPPPQPLVKSVAPVGSGVSATAVVAIELQDYVTQVDSNSIQLSFNGAVVTPIIDKPVGSDITTITYDPPGDLPPESTNTVRVVFGDTSTPAILQTNVFTFSVRSDAKASLVVNLDFNGFRAGEQMGPTFVGQGAPGGGTVFNGLAADSTGGDDNLTVGGQNLLNSLGSATPISFTVSPMAGDSGVASTLDPTWSGALFGDYIFNNAVGNTAGQSPFVIGGLSNAPLVDIYVYWDSGRPGAITIPGSTVVPYTGNGIFNSANTWVFRAPVVDGEVTGAFGPGLTVVCGLSILKPLPQPVVKSVSPLGSNVSSNAAVVIQLQDYVTQVATNTIQLLVNGRTVSPTISKADSITSVTYTPVLGFSDGSSNTVKIVFGDSSTPPVVQSNQFTFTVFNNVRAAQTINLDFNGFRPGDEAGPTFAGQGAAGGGTVFNGLSADSTGGDDNLTVGGTNFLNSLGGATPVSFTVSPVGGDSLIPATTDPTSSDSLFGDYIFNNSGGNVAGQSPFIIGGLGADQTVDIYVYMDTSLAGGLVIPGSATISFSKNGVFTSGNTRIYRAPVTDGQVTGVFSGGPTVVYGLSIVKPLPPAVITLARSAADLVLTWQGGGTLQSSTNLAGPYVNMPGSPSPFSVGTSGTQMFYRVRQ